MNGPTITCALVFPYENGSSKLSLKRTGAKSGRGGYGIRGLASAVRLVNNSEAIRTRVRTDRATAKNAKSAEKEEEAITSRLGTGCAGGLASAVNVKLRVIDLGVFMVLVVVWLGLLDISRIMPDYAKAALLHLCVIP